MATRQELANALRVLAMDAVQKANSGHPGMPMGMAEIAEVLWNHHLRFNPADPHWPDRDRFVVSNGHGSMLLYGLLHLAGFDLSMDELKRFRQLHSKTPGHPEYGLAPGVETTTGPLGQGIANAVGMAIAERELARAFNKPDATIVDHRTYVFLGDGCLMEGISHEVCSLAGTLGLNKLIALYDDNGISIDSEKGRMDQWFTEDTPKRFEAYGWNVIRNVDGHDFSAVEYAITAAKRESARPTLVCCRTTIGQGSPNKANTGAAHGSPLGEKEVAATREKLAWPHAPFEIPKDIYAGWNAQERGAKMHGAWSELFAKYKKNYPYEAAEFERRVKGELPAQWRDHAAQMLAKANDKAETIATRKASQNTLESIGPVLPELMGGSADLAASNLTLWAGSKGVKKDAGGNYLFYGVREFGMCAVMNGLVLHGGFIPYGGTFLVFSDYARNALRMAALMGLRGIYVFTHDSIGLGEDGPTHQAVEHAASLRLIPNMDVWRPCDATETAAAWVAAVERRKGPSALLLSRQNLPHVARDGGQMEGIRKGAYVLADTPNPKAVLIATGSEVALALAAQKALAAQGVAVRVVSMPCTSVFDAQDAAYKAAVLPGGLPRVAIEAGVTDYWRKYVGLEGAVVGMDRFGESAPAGDLFKYFGFTTENVVAKTKGVLHG
ncbi:MAG: transketolase [Burkholderiales bacterium]